MRSYFEVANPGVILLRYEDLLADGEAALGGAMSKLTGESADPPRATATLQKFAFRRQASRPWGQEDRSQFLRKGQAGDWVNHFTRESAEVFDRYCGDVLITAGYEPDHAWIDSIAR